MNTFTWKHGLAGLGLLVALPGVASADLVLPAADCGFGPTNNCVVFDDFTSYSLALSNFQAGYGDLSVGDPFRVATSPGQIANYLVIGSNANVAINNQDLGIGNVDNGYYTPNNVPGGAANFLMDGGSGNDGQQATTGSPATRMPDPIVGFPGDNIRMGDTTVNNNATDPGTGADPVADGTLPLWDVPISSLLNYLGSGVLTFMFNLNEENGGTLDNGQDLLVYADVYLTDVQTGNVKKYTLSGNSCGGGACPGAGSPLQQAQDQTANVDDILPTADDKWAYVHGKICVLDDGSVIRLGECTAADLSAGGQNVNQSLGAEEAAFAVVSLDLNDDIRNGVWDVLSVDLRMSHVGGGYEQIFILGSTITDAPEPPRVPEPQTLALFGVGLAALGVARRRFGRRRRRAA
ncbi:MAG: PEP-CTERM sorting domain-containing protein [Hyphomicrobiales bacterium]|nr:PEP-CTERM sorting domain-containing protein [Hyphomicrobiales bacterium]